MKYEEMWQCRCRILCFQRYKYDMHNIFGSSAQSLCQALEPVLTDLETKFNPGLAGVAESNIHMSVQSTIEMNLQRVRNVPTNSCTWTLGIAFDVDTIGEKFYLDPRIFVLVEAGI